MSGLLKWTAVALFAAAPAALLAYVGGPIAHGGLAAWAAFVIVALAVRHDRRLAGVRATATQTARDVNRMRAQGDKLGASVAELKAENAALKKQLTAARTALDNKIAIAVQRIGEKMERELRGLTAAIRDSEVESGLDALNRYIALATPPANPREDDDPPPHRTAT